MAVMLATAASSRLTCSVITDAAQLERLAGSWQDLLQRSASNEPILSPLWLQNWWEVFGPHDGRRLCVCCFFRDERLIGLAPLLRRRWWYRPGIPFWRLEVLGTGEDPNEAIHPDYVNILAERDSEQEVVRACVRALLDGAVGDWDELVLPQMDGDGNLLPLLEAAFRDHDLVCDCQITSSASYIPLPSTWEAYLQMLSASRRGFVRQSLRRFEQWAGADACFHSVRDRRDLPKGKHVLTQLHQDRWGPKEGKFGSPRFAAFHDRVLPALLEAGALEMLWQTVRDEPIASVYNILWNDKVYFYQSGRKSDAPSGQRPGIVLHAHAIRRAIENGWREYDFLGGGEHYKKQMALATRPLVQLRVVRPILRERLRLLTENGMDLARTARRRFRAAWRGKNVAGTNDDASANDG